jgi:hypothetical protein
VSRGDRIRHEFVEYIPTALEEGTLYISIAFATAVHRCCCGCGQEVVTPLTPTDWALTFDGETASLDPSIGNWGFDCQSHYWIRRNRVHWAGRWTAKQIAEGRALDRTLKEAWAEGASHWDAAIHTQDGDESVAVRLSCRLRRWLTERAQ